MEIFLFYCYLYSEGRVYFRSILHLPIYYIFLLAALTQNHFPSGINTVILILNSLVSSFHVSREGNTTAAEQEHTVNLKDQAEEVDDANPQACYFLIKVDQVNVPFF